ncbi:SprT-like domain-containing protein [Rubrolithibacter danxiaensis]|uniref:SprT-like domain-containing protein n=1 Tax=Rubrolithibacter danxiaensis TaxID=3390805 RepID=UPI003BF7F17A
MDKVKILQKYLPPEAAPDIGRWIDYFKCEFKVSRSRNSKFGDYRPPFKDKGHRISVNYNLNQYAFLITTVHEFAHLLTWNEHKQKAKPHGTEWKLNFRKMMQPFFNKNIFPEDIKAAIVTYLNNPAASSCTDLTLFRTLKKYDLQTVHLKTVEALSYNSIFAYKDKGEFRKGELVRKRYKCTQVKTGLVYLFSPFAEVVPLEAQSYSNVPD